MPINQMFSFYINVNVPELAYELIFICNHWGGYYKSVGSYYINTGL